MGYDTEDEATVALRLNGYAPYNEAAGIWVKDGYKVKIVRDGWKAKYFIKSA